QDEMKSTAQKYELMASETGQEIKREVESVDKVIQAMSLTDGGLSLQEYEKDKAAAQAAEMAATEPAAEPASLSDAPAEPASAAAMEKDRPV
ncbi:MAG: hypothetical protein PHS77_01880, partial [Gallionellaceae bacterium]|nr:hypothetical protein [Gallionellaceae bacterium]